VVSFTPRPFYTLRKNPGTHWMGGWVSPRTGLGDVERIKSYPYRDSNSDPSTVQPVASPSTYCAIPTPLFVIRTKQKHNPFFIHSSVALQPIVVPWPLLQFRNLSYTESRAPFTGHQPVARPLPAHRTQTQNKRTQTSMP
jgi:hypothetical protein